MTSQRQSVVTLERFQQGKSWKEWQESNEVNRDKFLENYDATTLSVEEVAVIKQLIAMPRGPNVWGVGRHAPARVLALVEPWCPDVYRGLPVMARLCEATSLELRIFLRDQNLDIMQEFLNKDEFQSIPTFVFYTVAHEYLTHWIEKPIKAREEDEPYVSIVSALDSIVPEERQKIAGELAAFERGPIWAGWRQAQVRETRLILQTSLERAARLEDLLDMTMND